MQRSEIAKVSQELVERCDNLSCKCESSLEVGSSAAGSSASSCAPIFSVKAEMPAPQTTHAVQQKLLMMFQRRLCGRIGSAASFGASTIRGSRTVKVEPRLGSLSTVMSPPII
jgi:hypothetical protein